MKPVHMLLTGLFWTGLTSAALADGVPAQEHTRPHVLVLQSYHRGMPWDDNLLRGIRDVLTPTDTIDLHVESMDTKRIFTPEHVKHLLALYRNKFKNIEFALIITSDNNAFAFVRKYRSVLFPRAPVVFVGLNDFRDEDIQGLDWVTGMAETMDVKGTIDTALTLHPNTKTVYVLNDYTPTGLAMKRSLIESLKDSSRRPRIVFSRDAVLDELLKDIEQLPDNALVYLGAFFRDKTDRYYSSEETTRLLVKHSPAPVYTSVEDLFRNGVVGGNLIEGYVEGKRVALIGKRILAGTSPASIPVVRIDSVRPVYDHNALVRWNVDTDLLPADSIIRNQPTSFYEEHKAVIWPSGLVIAILLVSILVLLRAVHRRKRAEEELARHRDHLEELVKDRTVVIEAQRERVLEASRLKSEFLSTMSHELRTPLNSILALSHLMLSRGTGKDCDEDAKFLSVIERNGRHLLELINDVLDLSSIEAGKTRVSPSEFVLDEVVHRVLTVVRPLVDAKALQLEVDLADIPTMYSDQERIEQILLNLLGNAVKFTDAGQIAVTASESGGTISLSVADTGIGINPDVLPQIFDRFRQADGSDTRKYEGTGLGLAISQKLAGLLGGQITVTSEPEKGSMFTVKLPVRMADVVQAEEKESPSEAGATCDVADAADADLARAAGDRASETDTDVILVVEDNEDNLLATTATLDSLGYQCVTAVNGELALNAARTHVPALILMDIQLPEMDGLEATRRIKTDATLKDIPIVALTAKAMKGDREEILAAGCDDYLSKPIDLESLRQVLGKWLN
jgi:signal transduction histidine kinase/CheY-like chemotaxis protein